MMPTYPFRSSNEVPMSVHQRGLVDSCFEELQYEEGVILINQLRSPNVRPVASHIRALLYIALYPPYEDKQTAIDPSLSPSKIAKQHQKFLTFSPTIAASACSLLAYFTITNRPDGIAIALPSYDRPDADNEGDNYESFIYKESRCISAAKSCWNILERGFIRRAVTTSSPTKKGQRRRNVHEDDDDDDDFDTPRVIAEHAWPVLDFLLLLFEHDERESEAAGLPRYSPLLLNQIPAPRSGKDARWETELPLSIVLHALIQVGNDQRQMMGARLIHLLINLCSTNLFDFTMFLNSVFNQIYTPTPKEFLELLASIPPTIPVLKFRIALFHKFLSGSAENAADESLSRSKSQARARPIRRARGEVKHDEELPKNQPTSIFSQILLSPYTEIRRSLEEEHPPSNTNISYPWIRFQLVLTFGLYQAQLPTEARDQEWQTLVHSGNFPQHLEKILPHSEDSAGYRDILEGAMLPTSNG